MVSQGGSRSRAWYYYRSVAARRYEHDLVPCLCGAEACAGGRGVSEGASELQGSKVDQEGRTSEGEVCEYVSDIPRKEE